MLGEVLLSVAGIVFIVTLTWWLTRARPRAPLVPEAAKAIAEDVIAGFDADAAFVDPEGRGAVVSGRDGRLAALKPQGDHWSVRVLTRGALRVDGDDLIVAPREAMFGTLRLRLGADAARMLAGRMGER